MDKMKFKDVANLPQQMVSPFKDGAKANLRWQEKEVIFKREKWIISAPYYKCESTHQEFTTDALDQIAMDQIWEQWEAKYGKKSLSEGGRGL